MVEKNIRLKTHLGNGVYDTLHPETNSEIVRVGDKNLDETLGDVTAQLKQTFKTSDTGVLDLNVFDEDTRATLLGLSEGEINAVLGIGNVHPINTSFFDIKNIPIEFIDGKIIQNDGVEQVNTDWYITNYLNVAPLQSYAINFNGSVHFYTESEVWISWGGVINNSFFTVPSNAKTIRFTKQLSEKPSYPVFVEGKTVKTLEEVKPTLKTEFLPTQNLIDYWLKNKIVLFYGDSISQQDYFLPILNSKFGFYKYYKQGIGGTTIANNGRYSNVSADALQVININVPIGTVPTSGIVIPSNFCMQERIDLMPLDSQVVFVMGGTNDDGQNIPIGDFSAPYDDTTFSGATILMIQRIKKRLPNAVIFVCSPIFGRNPSGKVNLSAPVKNSLSNTIMDYGDAIKKACEITSTFYVPVGETSGVSFYNVAENTEDGVHPTKNEGAVKIANAIFNNVKDYQPIN